MSSPPGRRAAPKSSRPEGQDPTPPTRPGGRRASEPTTGTLPVINAPLLGDEPTSGGGRRIKPVAPVSSAPEQGDRLVIRSFDHTGEIPAVQVALPEPSPVAHRAPDTSTTDADLPPTWEPLVREVPSTPVPPDAATVLAAADALVGDGPADDGLAAEAPRPRGRRVKDVPVDSISMPALTPEVLAAYEASQAAASEERDAHAAESAEAAAPEEQAPAPTPDESVRLSRRERRRLLLERAADPAEVPTPADTAAATPSPPRPQPEQPSPLSRTLAEEVRQATGQEPDDVEGLAEPLSSSPKPERSRAEDGAVSVESGGRGAGALSRLTLWSGVLLLGVVLLSLAALHVGPAWFDGAGAVAVLTTYCWAAAARTGGRQVVFSALGLTIGVAALLVDGSVLRSGAAVMTCVTSGVLAVVLTVPAKNFLTAVREVVVATAIASIGAFATIGFEPVASTSRFELLTLIIGMGVMVALVWRFAAGLHGLGTRGLVIVVVGTVLLAASQLYAEVLRNYGEGGLMGPTSDVGGWLRDTIGASPRMIMVLLGVPALVWGVHMRARRRQGWWVCTFGAAATLPVAQRLVNLETSYVEAGLQTFYSVALGCLVGWALIAADQRMTGSRGSRAAGDGNGLRPEPRRFSSL